MVRCCSGRTGLDVHMELCNLQLPGLRRMRDLMKHQTSTWSAWVPACAPATGCAFVPEPHHVGMRAQVHL